jgi:hypothetical protein
VAGESAQEFAALEAALTGELAPDGALQGLLAGRIAAPLRLRLLKALQAEPVPDRRGPAQHELPIEPDARRNPGEPMPMPVADEPERSFGGGRAPP